MPCLEPHFGCLNALLLARPANQWEALLGLQMTVPNELTASVVRDNGCDECRVGFAPREHAVGARGHLLDRMVDHPNSHWHALYCHNSGNAIAEIVDEMV